MKKMTWRIVMVFRRAIALIIGLAVPLVGMQIIGAPAQAAELKVLSSTALKAVLEELAPQFEKATEVKVVLTIAASAVLKARIDQGAAFDVAVLAPNLIDSLAAAGKVDPNTRAAIARSGLGVSVRAGAATPDVGTAEALKRTLLDAKSIGFNGQGASRVGIEALFAKLGIAEELKPKIVLLKTNAPEGVARGEVELALSPISEIVAVSGAQLAGAVPAEYQTYLTLVAAIAADSPSADAARSLIKYLTAPAASPVIKAKGMEPG
jgi:molybdate transport system substrate-binding protein